MPVNPKATPEEADIIEAYIVLPLAIKVLERDRKVIQQTPVKFTEPYMNVLDRTIMAIREDLREVRMEMNKRKMKVWQREKEKEFIAYSAIVRGYEDNFKYWSTVLKQKTEQVINKYMNE